MVNGNVGFGKDEMCSYKHTHNSAVHTQNGSSQTNSINYGDGDDNSSNSKLNTKPANKPLISGPYESGSDISNNWNNFWYRAGVKANNIDRSWQQGGKKFFEKVFSIDGLKSMGGGAAEFLLRHVSMPIFILDDDFVLPHDKNIPQPPMN